MGLIMYGGTPYGGVRKSSSASSAALDSFLDGSFATGDYVNDRVTKVCDYGFSECPATSISLPNVTEVGDYAFYGCTSLTSVAMPISHISQGMFQNCSSLVSLQLLDITDIDSQGLSHCSSFTSLEFPYVTTLGNSVFEGCSSLSSIYLPEAVNIGNFCFYGCAISSILLPKLTVINMYLFGYCNNLHLIDLPKCTSFYEYSNSTFTDTASNLKLILRNNSVCALGNNPSNTFYGSAFASTGSGGTLYVPQSLVSAYKNDTKWKQVMNFNANNQILPIEGSPYENT